MNFRLYKTNITHKVICPYCNQHFTVKDLNDIECENCHYKSKIVDKELIIRLYERGLLFNTDKFDDIKEVISCKESYIKYKEEIDKLEQFLYNWRL